MPDPKESLHKQEVENLLPISVESDAEEFNAPVSTVAWAVNLEKQALLASELPPLDSSKLRLSRPIGAASSETLFR